jgi:NAD(P)-dependent dehydrogenase (short-subunit alcohol dehydrogenase family)
MMKKTAIITGGARGIGLAITKRLYEDGFNVAVMGMRSHEEAGAALDDLPEYLYVQGDVGSAADRERLLGETIRLYGALHVLVNNAGVAPLVRADLLEMTEESFDRVIGVNTKSAMFLTQICAKQMLKQEPAGSKRGTIINISSCSAEVSSPMRGEYCVSKAGVAMLTKLFADRLAREGVFVHEIRPGIITTDMTASVTEKYDAMLADGVFPIARWGTGEDVAKAVSAFAGDTFLYTTGNHIDVDGGFHIKRL